MRQAEVELPKLIPNVELRPIGKKDLYIVKAVFALGEWPQDLKDRRVVLIVVHEQHVVRVIQSVGRAAGP